MGWRLHAAGNNLHTAGSKTPSPTLTTEDDESAPARLLALLRAAACRAFAFVWRLLNSSNGSVSAEHRKRTLRLKDGSMGGRERKPTALDRCIALYEGRNAQAEADRTRSNPMQRASKSSEPTFPTRLPCPLPSTCAHKARPQASQSGMLPAC